MQWKQFQLIGAASAVALILFLFIAPIQANPVPERRGYVTDLASVMPDRRITALEQRLKNHHDAGGSEIVVLIVKDCPESGLIYGRRILRAWRPGHPGRRDGVVILFDKSMEQFIVTADLNARKYIDNQDARNRMNVPIKQHARKRKYALAVVGVARVVTEIMNEAADEIASRRMSAPRVKPLPLPTGHVTDETNTLKPHEIRRFNQRLKRFYENTAPLVRVLLVKDTGRESPEAFSRRVVKQWDIKGRAGRYGTLFLLIKKDRRVFIISGQRDDQSLRPERMRRLIEAYIQPHLERGDYAMGIGAGIDKLIDAVRGRAVFPDEERPVADFMLMVIAGMILLAVGSAPIVLIIVLFIAFKNRRKIQRAAGIGAGSDHLTRNPYLDDHHDDHRARRHDEAEGSDSETSSGFEWGGASMDSSYSDSGFSDSGFSGGDSGGGGD